MILYEWVYDRGKIAEGVFCSEECAENMYFDNPRTCYKGGPSPIDEQESEELVGVGGWETCYGCGKPLRQRTETMTFYLTFGIDHPLCDNWIEIEAPDSQSARRLAFLTFGPKWSSVYSEKRFEPEHFPMGKVGWKMRDRLPKGRTESACKSE